MNSGALPLCYLAGYAETLFHLRALTDSEGVAHLEELVNVPAVASADVLEPAIYCLELVTDSPRTSPLAPRCRSLFHRFEQIPLDLTRRATDRSACGARVGQSVEHGAHQEARQER